MNSKFQSKLDELKNKIKSTAQEKRKNDGNQGLSKAQLYGNGSFFAQIQNEEEEAKFFKKEISKPNIIPQLEEWPPKKNKKEQPILYDLRPIPEKHVNNELQNEDKDDIQSQIKCMVMQRNADLQDDVEDEQKMKEMIVNTIRNKKPVRHKKRFEDPPTPFEELSEPYQLAKIFAQYLQTYKKRRQNSFKNGKLVIDLGVRYIHEIVVQCIQNDVIQREYMKCYPYQKIQNQIEFIKGFSNNDLSTFNFSNILFTSLDHRELCEMLISKYPERYTLGEKPYCVFKELSDFYTTIYQMEEQNYKRVLKLFRKKYNCYWWEYIGIETQFLNVDIDEKFETSTFYQPGPSPLFGADIDDPDNDFEKAKKRLYPNKEYKKLGFKAKGKKQEQSSSSNDQDNFKSQQSDNEDSDENDNEEKQVSSEGQQDLEKNKKKNFESFSVPPSMNSEFDFSYRKIFENSSQLESDKLKSKEQRSSAKMQSEEKSSLHKSSKQKKKSRAGGNQRSRKDTRKKRKEESDQESKPGFQSSQKPKQNSDLNQSSISISKMSSIGHSKLSLFPNLSEMELKSESQDQKVEKGKRSKKRGTGERPKKRVFKPGPSSRLKSKPKSNK